MPPAGGAGGGGEVVNEEAFRAVAQGLKDQDLLSAVKIWYVAACHVLVDSCLTLDVHSQICQAIGRLVVSQFDQSYVIFEETPLH